MRSRILFGILFLLFVLSSAFHYMKYSDTNDEILQLKSINDDISKMDYLDGEFNIFFSKRLELLNNDLMANSSMHSKIVLTQLRSDLEIYNDRYTKNGKELMLLMDKVESEFAKKMNNISTYNETKLKILANIKILNDYYKKIPTKDNYFSQHMKIMGLEYQYRSQIQDLLMFYINQKPVTSDEQIYVESAREILKGYSDLNTLNMSVTTDRLKKALVDMRANIDDKISNIRYKNKRYSNLFLFSIVLFVLYMFYLYYIYSKKSFKFATYHEFLNNFTKPAFITDEKYQIRFANKAAQRLIRSEKDNYKKQNIFNLLKIENSESFVERMKNAFAQNREIFKDNVNLSHNKRIDHVNIEVKKLFIESAPNFAVTIFDKNDVASLRQELESRVKDMHALTYTDDLTKTNNFAALEEKIKSKAPGRLACMNILNFNDFRIYQSSNLVNEALLQIYNSIQTYITQQHLQFEIYHAWMDEFYLWYSGPDLDMIKDLTRVSDYISNKSLKSYENSSNLIAQFRVIFGVSSRDSRYGDKIYESQIALNQARQYSQTIVEFTSESAYKRDFSARQETIRALQYALNNDKVYVECQGIYDITGDKAQIWCYEILVRIIDEYGNKLNPAAFLKVAKDTSLYPQLSSIIIRQAFSLIEKFPRNRFSINISAIDIVNSDLRGLFKRMLSNCNHAQNLTIEILESEGVEDYDTIADFVKEVREYGCKIAIDDFGSSYSNYYRIISLDIDYIKIDGSIIKLLEAGRNPKAMAIVETIINLARSQGYDVVAEFVANDDLYKCVKTLGIRFAQGYALGKPISPHYLEN